MELVKIIGLAVITAIVSVTLKVVKPELSFAALLVGIILILTAALDLLQDAFSIFQELSAVTGIDDSLIKILLKIVGVGYLTEFASELLTDFGSQSLSSKVELCGKITIFSLSVPIFRSLITLLTDLLSLV